MKVGVIRHVSFEDLGVLGPILSERDAVIETWDAGVGEVPSASLHDADLVVVLGGPIGLADMPRYPFLADEVEILGRRIDAGRATLGICLGAQLIAAALGAAVAPMGRTEIGYGPVELTAAGRRSALVHLGDAAVLHWHGDRFELPPGGELLASTAVCENQAFAVGPAVLGLQFHLENRPSHIEQWLVGHAGELVAAGLDPAAIRDAARTCGSSSSAAGAAVLNAWLDGLGA